MTPRDCPTALDWLQARIDGDSAAPPDAVRSHLIDCTECRERFQVAELLLLARPRRVVLADRIVTAVAADAEYRRRRRWLTYSGVGLAASVSLWFLTRPPIVPDVPVVAVVPAAEPVLDVGRVGDAVVALSRRTAADVADQGRLLLPELAIPATLPGYEGSAKPLEEARTGLAESFEPVASSAKRAFGLVWRDFGTGRQ